MSITILGANSASGEYEISNSIIMGLSSGYMERTQGTPTNAKKATISCWIRRACNFGANQTLISWNSGGGSQTYIRFANSSGNIQLFNDTAGETDTSIITTQVVRDPAAWYHFVLQWDSAQSTASNRVKMYLNGEQITSFGTSNYPPQNTDFGLNVNGNALDLGTWNNGSELFESYLAEFHFVDGTISAHTDFGKFDDNNTWIPKQYGGAHGDNGFFLKFDQTGTSANASGMGADSSGNGNHFSITDLPSTAIVTESPNLTWAYLSQIAASDSVGSTGNIESGGLRLPTGNTCNGLTHDNIMLDGGKWYFEVYLATSSSFNSTIGFRNNDNGDDDPSVEVENDRQVKKDGSNVGSSGGNFANGGVVGVKLDWSNTSSRKIEFLYENGALSNAGEQTFRDTGTNSGFRGHFRESGSGSIQLYNFGQNPGFFGNLSAGGNADANGYGNFQYSVPSGYYSINSKNLAEYGGI